MASSEPQTSATSNLMVALRIRPLNSQEKRRANHEVAFKVDEKSVVLLEEPNKAKEFLGQNRSKEKKFVLDVAFGPGDTQHEVHEKTTLELIDNVISGYNGTVFAYGATGTGKTYTMLGTDRHPGIMTRALDDLFQKVQLRDEPHLYTVKISYFEIYNETMRDLLHPDNGYLDLRQDSKGVMHVAGLSETVAKSSRQVLSLLMDGNRRRTQEPTGANKTSSRSHAVLQVTVMHGDKATGLKTKEKIGKLFLIDLAGSERASKTNNRGIRMKEGAAINKSLLALGNVINTLGTHMKAMHKYVNYRDSKLTRLLKDSLGGSSRTVMIAHISSASNQFEETSNTLIYANRAKNITSKLSENSTDITYHVAEYQNIISDLRREIVRLNQKIATENSDTTPEIKEKLTRSQSAMACLNESQSLISIPKQVVLPPVVGDGTVILSKPSQQTSTNGDRRQFLEFKDKLTKAFQEQTELRGRLQELNDRAYAVAIGLSSKSALLEAWQNKQRLMRSETIIENEPEPIQHLRTDVDTLEQHTTHIENERALLEQRLEENDKHTRELQSQIMKMTNSECDREMITLLSALNQAQSERIALESDLALRSRRLEKYDVSLRKIRKYGGVCEQLISVQHNFVEASELEFPPDTADLYNEYKGAKTQAHYHMLPLNDKAIELGQKSWNRLVIEKISYSNKAKTNKTTLSKTFTFVPEKESDFKLPHIASKDDTELVYKRKTETSIGALNVTKRNDRSMPNTPLLSRNTTQSRTSMSSAASSDNSTKSRSKKKRSRSKSKATKNPNRRLKSPSRPHLPVIIHK